MANAQMIPLTQILPNSKNVRMDESEDITELAATIQEVGLLQPLTVTTSEVEGRYVIIAGHRRARALRLLGKEHAPCVVRDVHDLDKQTAMMLIENTQRKDLNPVEQAKALDVLRRAGKTVNEIAKMVGKSDPWVSYRLGILELSDEYISNLMSGEMKMADAEKIVRAKRRAERDGQPMDRGWEAPYLAKTHNLAKTVKRMCAGRGHAKRRLVGGIGCGQCWEYVIRQDERTVIAVERDIKEQQIAEHENA